MALASDGATSGKIGSLAAGSRGASPSQQREPALAIPVTRWIARQSCNCPHHWDLRCARGKYPCIRRTHAERPSIPASSCCRGHRDRCANPPRSAGEVGAHRPSSPATSRGAFCLPIANRQRATIARRNRHPDIRESPGRRQAGRGFLRISYFALPAPALGQPAIQALTAWAVPRACMPPPAAILLRLHFSIQAGSF
jgi:hypothetical protein